MMKRMMIFSRQKDTRDGEEKDEIHADTKILEMMKRKMKFSRYKDTRDGEEKNEIHEIQRYQK